MPERIVARGVGGAITFGGVTVAVAKWEATDNVTEMEALAIDVDDFAARCKKAASNRHARRAAAAKLRRSHP